MTKPFTGEVTERSEIPFETHCGWDMRPFGTGAVPVPEPGPAVRELERRRGEPAHG